MRIGEFAQKHNMTIDTIRHYMELGLILPERKGGHYTFNATCSSDLQEIVWLRSVNFTLAQIQKIFSFKRLVHLPTAEHNDYLAAVLFKQRNSLAQEQTKLEQQIAAINHRLTMIDESGYAAPELPQKPPNSFGVPLGFLPNLACPTCHLPLNLPNGTIKNNMVLDGELRCSCGLQVPIADGVIITPEKSPTTSIQSGSDNDSTADYIERTAVEFVNFMYKGIQWIINRLEPLNLNGKIILELGTGSGIFLRHFRDLLPNTGFYVVTDNDIARLHEVKALLEQNFTYPNFVFMCADFLNLPLRNESADIVLDFWGSTNYNFTHPGCLLDLLADKVKPGGSWIGSYAYFHPKAKSLIHYVPECRSYFNLPFLQKVFAQSPFKVVISEDLGYVDKGGVYETFFVPGDRCFQWAYHGEKQRFDNS